MSSKKHYDAIIVGARCAGAPLAMLLARQGLRVLLVDRAEFPSNKLSTHFMKRAGVSFIKKWGLLEAISATSAPPITHWDFNHDGIRVLGQGAAIDGVQTEFALRRLELDQILINAAVAAGAEFKSRCVVNDVLWRDNRVVGISVLEQGTVQEYFAPIVVGADGMNSRIAARVKAAEVVSLPSINCGYFGYFAGLPLQSALESHQFSDQRLLLCFPTNDDLHMVFLFWPVAQAKTVRKQLEQSFFSSLQRVPSLYDKVRAGKQVGGFSGAAMFPHFKRQPWGAGWALAGDAAMHRDPITAYGMTHAFADAELLAQAIVAFSNGDLDFDQAMSGYEQYRNNSHQASFEATFASAKMRALSANGREDLMAIANAPQQQKDQFITQLDSSLTPLLSNSSSDLLLESS